MSLSGHSITLYQGFPIPVILVSVPGNLCNLSCFESKQTSTVEVVVIVVVSQLDNNKKGLQRARQISGKNENIILCFCVHNFIMMKKGV